MSKPPSKNVEQILADLLASLAELDAHDAPIAAAYLDSAIEALSRQYGIPRDDSKTERLRINP